MRWFGSGVAGLFLLLAVDGAKSAEEFVSHAKNDGDAVALQVPRAKVADEFVSHPANQALSLLSRASVEVIGSLVISFLGKENLDKERLMCMVTSSEQFASDVMEMVSNLVMMLQSGLGMPGGMNDISMDALHKAPPVIRFEMGSGDDHEGEEEVHKSVKEQISDTKAALAKAVKKEDYSMAAHLKSRVEALEAAEAFKEATAKNTSEALDMFYGGGRRLLSDGAKDAMKSSSALLKAGAVFIDVGVTLQNIVLLAHHIGEDCVQGDTLRALQTAARHMKDLRYVAGHFLVNGADVVEELTDSVAAYHAQNFTRFGADLGNALRKVFLSHEKGIVPEAVLTKEVMASVAQGLVKGFFGKGFTMNVKLDKDPMDPLHIDIEDCIASNMVFFQEVFSSVMYLYSSEVQGEAVHEGVITDKQLQQGSAYDDEEEAGIQKGRFGTAVALAMMQMPDALQKCGLGKDQASMLIDSVKNFGEGMAVTVATPNVLPSNKVLMDNLQKTLDDWSSLAWYEFGYDVGTLLQELLLALFPQEYSFDEGGVLRKELLIGETMATRLVGGGRALLVVPALLAAVVVAGRRFQRLGSRDVGGLDLEALSMAGVE